MCDYCWRNLFIPKMKELGVDTLPDKIVDVGFPKPSAPFNKMTNNVCTYLRSVKRNLILSYNKLKKPNKSKKGDAPKELTKGNRIHMSWFIFERHNFCGKNIS
jgi:hypothetical protein